MATQYTTGQPTQLSATGQTPWISLTGRKGASNSFTASCADEVPTFSGTWVVEARRHWFDVDGTEHFGTAIVINTATAAGVYTGQLDGQWQVRARVSIYTSGTVTLTIDR